MTWRALSIISPSRWALRYFSRADKIDEEARFEVDSIMVGRCRLTLSNPI